MTPLTFIPKNYDTFIGIDVDKNSFSFTVNNHFQMKKSKKLPSNPDHLYNYIQKTYGFKKVVCGYEAGPTGFHLYDYLNNQQIPCFITSPASIPKAPNEKVKTNRIDSVKITDHLMSGKMKAIRVPVGVYRELRHLIRIRENYAKDRKVAKQRVKALLLYSNLYPELKDPDSKWSCNYIKELKQIPCSFAVRQRLDMLLEDLEYARKKILSILRTLKTFCKEHKEINLYMNYLQSIPGYGFIVSVTLLGKIGDPAYLQNQREIAAYVGIIPKEKSTGDTIHKGSITGLGNHTLRFLLIEAAWVAIRKDTQLEQFYNRIKAKHHPRYAAKIAITAVARKLTQITYRVLKDKRMYVQY